MTLFLTADELRDLTGYQRHADQRKWLTAHGWVFEVSAIGRPIVSRAYADARLGGDKTIVSSTSTWSPNLAAIRKAA